MPASLTLDRSPESAPLSASDADEEEEILAEVAEDEPADEIRRLGRGRVSANPSPASLSVPA